MHTISDLATRAFLAASTPSPTPSQNKPDLGHQVTHWVLASPAHILLIFVIFVIFVVLPVPGLRDAKKTSKAGGVHFH
jgi:hypothetical protein